ncbi:MAG: hypothetical protein ABIL01_05360 [Pseudomonadota bacterium]
MKAVTLSTHEFDCDALVRADEHHDHELTFLLPRLDKSTAQLVGSVTERTGVPAGGN